MDIGFSLTVMNLIGSAAGGAESAPEMVAFFSWAGLVALLTLSALEIVLGIDNLVFISIMTDKLPENKRAMGRNVGLILAAVMRIGLLFAAAWLMRLDDNVLFTLPVLEAELTPKHLVLLVGGLFLIGKATWEIHHAVLGHEGHSDKQSGAARAGVAMVLGQILLLNIVFSIDSVITAVGMVSNLWIMSVAVLLAVAVMVFFAGPVSRFVQTHPSMKILALSFLVLIGVLLVVEGVDQHISRGYVYFAMAFSLVVELINMRVDKKRHRAQVKAGPRPEAAARTETTSS